MKETIRKTKPLVEDEAAVARYRYLFETMSLGVVYQDRDGMVVSANPAAERILGLTVEQMIGTTSVDSFWKMMDEHGRDVPGKDHPAMVALRTGKTVGPVDRCVIKPESNEYVWLSITAVPLFEPAVDTPYQVYATFEDISERKTAERKLLDQTEYLKKILETTTDAFVVVQPNRTISHVNDSACRMSGYTRDELIGMPISRIDAIEPSEAAADRLQRIMEYGSETFETQLRRKNGTVFDCEINISRVDQSDGVCLVNFCRDITERKRGEADLKRLLWEKETLLKEVHHRIKNSVASIEGFLSLQANSTESGEVAAALRQAASRVHSIRSVYEALLIDKNHKEVGARAYIERLVDSLVAVFSDQTRITTETKLSDFPLGTKQAVALGIVVNELLTNVFKYAFIGRDAGHVRITLEKRGTRVILTISDDGIGADNTVSTNNASGNNSSGFGLEIVRMLAEQLQGTYTIESDNGTRSVLEFAMQ